MRNLSKLALAAMLALLLGAAASVAGSFGLNVNDVSGLNEPWPMVGGLPFPEGELQDASQIRVVDADGAEVPAQIDVAATWRDGSVRWALAGINATPQGEYRVEFGEGVTRREPERPLRVEDADGRLTIDTGAAVYEFLPDRLLPESARMGETVFLSNAGDGAYLVDNRGRLSRVAGELAEVGTELVKQGPMRVVVRREGWYVTGDGERVARAKAWFYLTAGSPYLRITHTLVFTEDTNQLWVRDYGLEFNTPQAPSEAVFALSEATEADRFAGDRAPEDREMIADMFSSGLVEREQTLFAVEPGGDEVYLLQENYPHVLEREFRAVVARADAADSPSAGGARSEFGNLWIHPWLAETEVAGDWGEAQHGGHALMVVMPQLAQRFPKEIAIGPEGARVAFWSGRSGRELDFRAVTLVNEYWKGWADNAIHAFGLPHNQRGPAVGTRVASQPSNAQGAARTHDVWLLPRAGGMGERQLKARATAAAHPPLLQADAAWLGDSMAAGWPMHPKDTERFPEVEEEISVYWTQMLGGHFGHAGLRRTGFVMWGKNVTLGTAYRWFRLSRGAGHYGADRNAWQLYMRSGERRYYDYGRHFTRFAGDLSLHHWTVGRRFRGGFANPNVHRPFYWEGDSRLPGSFWTFGWLMEYYLTGDEYANELLAMVADAYREQAALDTRLTGYTHGHVYNLSMLYEHTQDETIKDLARQTAHALIDLDNPVGLNDDHRYGLYYKTSTEWLFPLYLYYNATGDETAREAILRAMDDKFRFFYSSNQTFRLFLFAEVHRWTGNPAYLRLINLMVEQPWFSLKGHNFFQGAPAALRALAEAEQPIEPFPVLAATREENSVVRSDFTGVGIMDHEFIEADALPPVLVRKDEGDGVTLSVFVRLHSDLDEATEAEAFVARQDPEGERGEVDGVRIVKEQRFKTRNPGRRDLRRWHFYVTLPQEMAGGLYRVEFPHAETIVVLESDAPEIMLEGY